MALRTYGAIQSTPEGWTITELEPHVALKLKAVFPRIQRTAHAPFVLTGGTQLDADLLWFMDRYPLSISDDDAVRMREKKTLFATEQEEITRILSDRWRPSDHVGFRHGRAPYPYQAQAAEVSRRLGRLLIMDDVGLGKTVSALAAITDPQFLPAAIVVQTHLASQWKEDYIEPFTHLRAHIVKKSTPYLLPSADVYIFKYSNIAGWVDHVHETPFASVIFDEVQELRHGQRTAKGHAARAFIEGAKLRIGLSATPIYNYGSEIWNVVEFIEPGALGPWDDFIREWCAPHGTHWVVKDPAALGTFLREQLLAIRRVEADVGDQMPPVNVITHTVPYDEEIAAADEELTRALAIKVTTGSFVERGQAARELDALARRLTGVAKAKHVAAFVRILLENETPALLIGWHREVYRIWMEELAEFRPVLYSGTESARQKDRAKRAFMDGHTNCLILSLRSGAGLDGLQHRGRTIVFGELDWSPLVHKQVIGRLRRPGQTGQVDAIYIHADGGSDPVMIETLGLKASQSHAIVDPLLAVPQQHTDESRIKMLAEQYLSGRKAPRPAPLPEIEPKPSASLRQAILRL